MEDMRNIYVLFDKSEGHRTHWIPGHIYEDHVRVDFTDRV
jgi:hypothetical protein